MKKEKPTREERLKAYEYARGWLNATMDNQVGICTLLRKAIHPSRLLILSDFPEFIEAKPKDKDVGGYWFSSAKERIQVLTEIINKMKEENRINVELPSDCEVKFDEENNVLIISKKKEGVYIPDSVDEIKGREWHFVTDGRRNLGFKNESTADAFMALAELVEMRDASNGDWRADWEDETQGKWIIECDVDDSICVNFRTVCRDTMSFKSEEIAQAFLKKHRELILTAKELL